MVEVTNWIFPSFSSINSLMLEAAIAKIPPVKKAVDLLYSVE